MKIKRLAAAILSLTCVVFTSPVSAQGGGNTVDAEYGRLKIIDADGGEPVSFESGIATLLGGEIEIKNYSDEARDYVMFLAGYNQNDYLIKLSSKEIVVSANTEQTLTHSFIAPAACVAVKAFVIRSVGDAALVVPPAKIIGNTDNPLMIPIWSESTDIVYNESLTMVIDPITGIASAPLFYQPTNIISVKNAERTMTYAEGDDWVLDGGSIRITPNSAILTFTENELYSVEKDGDHPYPTVDGRWLLYKEGGYFHHRQLAVTYQYDPKTRNSERWDKGTPNYAGNILPGTIEKLKNREKLRVVLFGDSISAGNNSSKLSNVPPYQPFWGELLVNQLRSAYHADIEFYNPSIPGESADGLKGRTQELVNVHNPDLVIIGLGMNDGVFYNASSFCTNVQSIINTVRAKNPACEFILIATSLPNQLALTKPLSEGGVKFYNYQYSYKEALDSLSGPGIAVANIRDMQLELMERKRFIDITENHINHPNDFFIRCYAWYLSGMLIED